MTVSNRDNKSRMFLCHRHIPHWQRNKNTGLWKTSLLRVCFWFCFRPWCFWTLVWFQAPGMPLFDIKQMVFNRWPDMWPEPLLRGAHEMKRVQVSAIHCKTETVHNKKTHQSQVINGYLLFLHWCFSSASHFSTNWSLSSDHQKWSTCRNNQAEKCNVTPAAFETIPSRSSCSRSKYSDHVIVSHSSCHCKSE